MVGSGDDGAWPCLLPVLMAVALLLVLMMLPSILMEQVLPEGVGVNAKNAEEM